MSEFGALVLIGFGVALIVGLTGVGGGSIMTPLLITTFGVPAPVAVGTDLACAAVTKSAGTIAHRSARNVETRIVLLLAAGSVPTAIATLALIATADLAPLELDHVIRQCVGVTLLVSIAMLLLRDPLRRWGARSEHLPVIRRHRPALTVLVGPQSASPSRSLRWA